MTQPRDPSTAHLPSDPSEDQPERHFAWSDMFADPDNDPRSEGGFTGERDTLLGYLRDQRLTLEMKCAGLDAEQLARRSVPPSTMSLLGLVRHLAGVEQVWFRIRMAGEDVPRLYREGGDSNGDFDGAVGDPAAVTEAFDVWRAEMAYADHLIAGADDLGMVGKKDGALREVIVHLIEEYARHNGHADLLRERIDGAVGQ